MAKVKKKTTQKKPSNSNAKPKPASATRAPNPKGKKLGERVENIREKLTLGQIEAERVVVCDLWRERGELDDRKKAAAAEFKAKLTDIDKRIKIALGNAQSGYRDVELTIEEWLTDQNQVQRYRADTGELIGDRNARAEDLQESLPGMDPNDEGDEDEGDEDEPDPAIAEGVAEVAADMKEAGDFGE